MAISSVVNRIANSKFLTQHLGRVINNPTYAARVLVGTNVVKDAVGCGFYVYQSLNNEKIPEEKRKFVAALDLANGVLMCATQVLLGFTISHEKVQSRICKKLFGSLEHIDPKVFLKCKTGFAAISSLLVSTIIAKRLIVPFIATPLATYVKNNVINKKGSEDQNKTQDTFVNSSQSFSGQQANNVVQLYQKISDQKASNNTNLQSMQ